MAERIVIKEITSITPVATYPKERDFRKKYYKKLKKRRLKKGNFISKGRVDIYA